MTSWALEGDGPVESIYHLLWRKNVHLESCPKVRIPDTVIYKYRQPAYWYFTSSQDHQLKKKARNNHGNNKIMEGFTSKPSISDIVAYYISTHFVKSPVKGKKDKKVTTIEYFDAKGLQDFLYNRDKVDNGFLQAFVDPKGSSHSIIRATWSPQVFLLERRVNKISITDRKFDMYQRAATYEGTEDQSVLAPVTAKKLVADLQFICNSIVQHVMATSPHHVRISRMVCNFKLDAHEKIWFLWCSSLRIMDKFQSSRGVPCPLELDDQMVPAKQWNPAQIQGQVPPICKSKFFKCPNCTTTTGSDCKCQITYKLAILHYNPHRAFQLAQVAPTPESLALTQAAMLTANADSQQEAAAAGPGGDGEAKPDLYYPIQQTGGTTGTGTSSMQLPTLESPEQDDEDSGGSIVIPPIVAYHHRKLRASQFLKMIQEPAFLYNSAYVCENCCLMFNKSATSLLAQFNFSDLQVENPRRSSDAFTAPTGRSSPSGDKDEVADHRPSTTHSSVRPSLSRPRTTPGTMGRRDLELSPRQQSEAGVKPSKQEMGTPPKMSNNNSPSVRTPQKSPPTLSQSGTLQPAVKPQPKKL
eukprot:gnl/Hemi2/15241_TR5141_c0_g12_i1.p1 gnl/Hemi2/15241_TR5141_c0_g12~~gnl/Hemi2/15241_TR5141_c0_g12_i1.p1  ORF type:complete len:583 (-),score=129.95 gnl/Hemi2/15241_TR5141_c0_g12_i1:429-2177(-)